MSNQIPDFSACKDEEDVHRLAAKAGFRRRITDGAYSIVLINNNRHYVVRISHIDDAWHTYAQWAMKKSRSKYVPKIYQLHELSDGTSVGVVERLYPLSDDERPSSFVWIQTSWEFKHRLEYWPVHLRPLIRNIHRLFVQDSPYDEIDIHDDNVMKRKDGTWIITDPIA